MAGLRSVRPTHSDPCAHFGLFFSRPADRLSLSRSVVAQYNRLHSRFFVRVGPVHGLCFPASLVLFSDNLHIGAPDMGWLCTSFSFEPSHALASLAVNRCCLASRATGAGVSPESRRSAPIGVVCLFVIILHSPPKGGAQLSYHKPADHWWSWHLTNIFIPLSIGNFLSIRRLSYGH